MGVKVCSCGYSTSQSKNVTSVPESLANQIVKNNTVCQGHLSDPRDVGISNQTRVDFTPTTQSENETSVKKSLANQNVKGKTVCNRLHSNPRDVGISNQKRDHSAGKLSRKKCTEAKLEGREIISRICNQFKLGPIIRDRANEIYRKVEGKMEAKRHKEKKHKALLAACVVIGCEQEGRNRALKEICSVVGGITVSEISQAKNKIRNEYIEMGEILVIKPVSARYWMKQFCSSLGMKEQSIRAAEEAMENSEKLLTGRDRRTVAGALISMITQLSHYNKLLFVNDISRAVGVGEVPITHVYKEIYPYASKLIPTWFANEEDLEMLTEFPTF